MQYETFGKSQIIVKLIPANQNFRLINNETVVLNVYFEQDNQIDVSKYITQIKKLTKREYSDFLSFESEVQKIIEDTKIKAEINYSVDPLSDSFDTYMVEVKLLPVDKDIKLINNEVIKQYIRFGKADIIDASPYIKLIDICLNNKDFESIESLNAQINDLITDPRIFASTTDVSGDSFKQTTIRVVLESTISDIELINNNSLDLHVRIGKKDQINVVEYLTEIDKLDNQDYDKFEDLEAKIKAIVLTQILKL